MMTKSRSHSHAVIGTCLTVTFSAAILIVVGRFSEMDVVNDSDGGGRGMMNCS